jgi:thiol:disulfide interchange protein
MKKAVLLLLVFSFYIGFSQEALVKWTTSVERVSLDEIRVQFDAKIAQGWHMYSQYLPEDSALPTVFDFGFSEYYELKGKTKEFGAVTHYDPVFDMKLSYFENKAQFVQHILLHNTNLEFLAVGVEYQTCDDTSCTLDFDEFNLQIPPFGAQVVQVEKLIPQKTVDSLSLAKLESFRLPIKENKFSEANVAQFVNTSHWELFFLGFIAGLIALLTPCVFPMVPLTVSFFTKQSGNRKKGIINAILYGTFIVGIYLLLSVPFHFLDSLDPEILNSIATNVWLNVFFFAIFIFFAFSFFGYYEITLPNSWGNKMDSASATGGIIGIFFMAVTLAIVSFSCTGPILGSLLAGSLTADGGALQLTMGMAGFGTALALPFALFALFPSWLQSLPKSGSWMSTVKVVLGFLELALALKFLSNADLVSHWGLLKRELFIGLWALIFLGLSLYLFGKIKFPLDTPIKKIPIVRKGLAIVSLVFVGYLVLGLTPTKYANLKLLSGFPPPMFYSYYPQDSECPLGLNCYKDFETGWLEAQKQNKPILLDFTGWACVNCRKMEENVWSNPEVFKMINTHYILISLYVDDKKELPKNEQFDFQKPNGKTKRIKTVGDKWATFQAVNFNTASQPYYILLSPDLEMLNAPIEYTNTADYLQWLKAGWVNWNR